MRVLSLGGGTQSCALALMSAAGDLPKVDHVIFADTQGELPETYEYLDYLRPIVEAAGIGWHVVTRGNLEMDVLSVSSTSPTKTRLPLSVQNVDGTPGRMSYTCSHTYKREVVERKTKQLCGGRGAWKEATIEQWIGFSLDELGRMKHFGGCRCGHTVGNHPSGGHCARCKCESFSAWQVNRWPLIELGMRRHDTIRWFAANGHPTPPRSACWFCPNGGNQRWSELKKSHPDLFERACALDEHHRNGGMGRNPIEGVAYFHGSLVPLRDADIRTKRQITADNGQGELFDDEVIGMDCAAGVCFT